jgi:hypothetical protein
MVIYRLWDIGVLCVKKSKCMNNEAKKTVENTIQDIAGIIQAHLESGSINNVLLDFGSADPQPAVADLVIKLNRSVLSHTAVKEYKRNYWV